MSSETPIISYYSFLTLNSKYDSYSSITNLAPIHWLNQNLFNDWGASMNICASTREMLYRNFDSTEHFGQFHEIQSTNDKWNNLIEKYKNRQLANEELLYLSRFLVYFGLPAESLKLLSNFKANTQEENYWSKYIINLINNLISLYEWVPDLLDVAELNKKGAVQGNGPFHLSILFSSYFTRYNINLQCASEWLNAALFCIENSELINKNLQSSSLSKIRYLRNKAVYYQLTGNSITSVDTFKEICDYSNKPSIKSLRGIPSLENDGFKKLDSSGKYDLLKNTSIFDENTRKAIKNDGSNPLKLFAEHWEAVYFYLDDIWERYFIGNLNNPNNMGADLLRRRYKINRNKEVESKELF